MDRGRSSASFVVGRECEGSTVSDKSATFLIFSKSLFPRSRGYPRSVSSRFTVFINSLPSAPSISLWESVRKQRKDFSELCIRSFSPPGQGTRFHIQLEFVILTPLIQVWNRIYSQIS